MKRWLGIFGFLCLNWGTVTWAQTPTPHPVVADSLTWKSFPEAVADAQGQGKKILVFVYTDWCGWCRKFQREVYTDAALRAYLTQHYTLAKVNAEGDKPLNFRNMTFTEAELSMALQASGFPTHIFMEPGEEKLNYIQAVPGFMEANRFLMLLRYFGEDAYVHQTFEEYQGKSGK